MINFLPSPKLTQYLPPFTHWFCSKVAERGREKNPKRYLEECRTWPEDDCTFLQSGELGLVLETLGRYIPIGQIYSLVNAVYYLDASERILKGLYLWLLQSSVPVNGNKCFVKHLGTRTVGPYSVKHFRALLRPLISALHQQEVFQRQEVVLISQMGQAA